MGMGVSSYYNFYRALEGTIFWKRPTVMDPGERRAHQPTKISDIWALLLATS